MALFQFSQENFQSLVNQLSKCLHGLSSKILGNVFKINKTIPYSLRVLNKLLNGNSNRKRNSTGTISFLYPLI